jgi:3-hydroxyacyl-CoA dehydrogenase
MHSTTSDLQVMKLLENVRGSKTSDLTISTMMAWGKRIGKWCILVGNCPGFVGNRMVNFYSNAAKSMLEKGMLPEQVGAPLAHPEFRIAARAKKSST